MLGGTAPVSRTLENEYLPAREFWGWSLVFAWFCGGMAPLGGEVFGGK
jgi:hypothetical protein